jgi:hypothetical protein
MKPELDPHIVYTVKTMMQQHLGSVESIPYDELTLSVFGKVTDNNRRRLRLVISHLNSDSDSNLLICSDRTDGGLFANGDSEEDVEKHTRFIQEEEAQALSTLAKLSAMKRKARKMYGDKFGPEKYAGQGRLL